jgi:branched-chain amino acid transport system ATP-binding protein
MLEVRGLVAGHGGAHFLDGIDLDLEEGGCLVLLGRNGMGKTTLLRTVMGLVPVAAGTIRFEGRDITGLRPDRIARAGIGWVPEGRRVFAALTVEENLRLGAQARGGRLPDGLLDPFPRLVERQRQPAGTLSGGEQQQLAIARALASSPRLLLLDEPSEGLQPSMVETLAGLLSAIRRDRRLGLLLVEQNLELALALAERAALIENGRIVAVHAVEELRRDRRAIERHLAV